MNVSCEINHYFMSFWHSWAMKTFTSPSQKVGQIGENIACGYLIRKGFTITERNYTQKWGEIDIIANNQGKTHFIEVKSVSCESFDAISHETAPIDAHRPEDQIHHSKRKRLIRIIQTYMTNHPTGEWQFDVVCVFLNYPKRLGRVQVISDVILS
jgi:putative endonuclease